MPSLLKLTLRDLLWLALLIASLTVGGIQYQRNAAQFEALKKRSFLRDLNAGPSPAAMQRRAALGTFKACTDDELDQQFAALAASGQWQHAADYEPCLNEMVRRRMVDPLQKHYDVLMGNGDPDRAFPYNLELLTALRRAQGKADPLQIEVSLGDPAALQIEGPAPVVKAVITNVDAGREAVHFTRGGDYRGGRRERWRAILTDEQGRVVRDSNFVSMIGGGMASLGPFGFGESDKEGHAFDLRRHVAPDRSGRYQLQLLYHNELDIADEPDLAGLIVTKSEPVEVLISVPAKGNAVGPGLRAMLAILAASAVLTLAVAINNRTQRPPAGSQPSPRTLISRRDLIWNCLLAAVALGVWFDDRYWTDKIASLTPDAEASWSIAIKTPENGL